MASIIVYKDGAPIGLSGKFTDYNQTEFVSDTGVKYKKDKYNKWNPYMTEQDAQNIIKEQFNKKTENFMEQAKKTLPMQSSTQNISPQEAEEYNKYGRIIMRGGTDVGNIDSTVKANVNLPDYINKKTGGDGTISTGEPDQDTLTLPQELINLYLQKSQGVDQPVQFRTNKVINPWLDILFTTPVQGLTEGLAREIQKNVTGEVGKNDALKTIYNFEKLTGKKFTKNGKITPSKKGLTYEQQKALEETVNLAPQRQMLADEQLAAQRAYYNLMSGKGNTKTGIGSPEEIVLQSLVDQFGKK